MSLDRRNFFKTLGAVGLSLTVGNAMASAKDGEEETEFYGVLVDVTRCIGCQSCELACAEAHSLPEPEDSPDATVLRKTDPYHRTVVNAFDVEEEELYAKNQCMHCNEPACAAACLTKAMYKTKEGPVIWRQDKCMGCRYCMISCPFEVPKFEYDSWKPKIEKCDMCYDTIMEGGAPACASNCPTEALVFGTRRELIAEAHKRIVEDPDLYENHIYGESEAGGTGFMYLAPVGFGEVGLDTEISNEPYPHLSKGFLYTVPAVFMLLPPALLGIYEATKNNKLNEEEGDE